MPAGLVLMSPEIGISRAAAYANWQAQGRRPARPRQARLELGAARVRSVQIQFLRRQRRRAGLADDRRSCAPGSTGWRRTAGSARSRRSSPSSPPSTPPCSPTPSSPASSSGCPSGKQHELVIFDVNRYYEAQGLLTKPIDLESLIVRPANGLFDRHRHQPRRRQLRRRAAQAAPAGSGQRDHDRTRPVLAGRCLFALPHRAALLARRSALWRRSAIAKIPASGSAASRSMARTARSPSRRP